MAQDKEHIWGENIQKIHTVNSTIISGECFGKGGEEHQIWNESIRNTHELIPPKV